jgi:hypothetical protein
MCIVTVRDEGQKRPSATYNLLALLNTRLNLGNMARRIVISKLLNLRFADHWQILFGR